LAILISPCASNGKPLSYLLWFDSIERIGGTIQVISIRWSSGAPVSQYVIIWRGISQVKVSRCTSQQFLILKSKSCLEISAALVFGWNLIQDSSVFSKSGMAQADRRVQVLKAGISPCWGIGKQRVNFPGHHTLVGMK